MTTPLTLGEVVADKRAGLVMVDARTAARRAVQLMNEVRSGAVLVIDRGALVGIVTERDVLRRIVAQEPVDLTLPVAQVMSAPVMSAPASMSTDEAMQLMAARSHRHLVVVEQGDVPIGLLSVGDLMSLATRELERWVVDLSTFIAGPAATVQLPSSALARLALPRADRLGERVTLR